MWGFIASGLLGALLGGEAQRKTQNRQQQQLEEAQRAEAERQARISALTGKINNAFGGRDDEYKIYGEDNYNLNKAQLDEQYNNARQQNLYAMARRGLIGSGVGIDNDKKITDQYADGILSARSAADNVSNTYKSADNMLREKLIKQAMDGADEATTMNSLESGKQTALAQAQSLAKQKNFGSFFNNLLDQYQYQQDAAAKAKGYLSGLSGNELDSNKEGQYVKNY